MELLDARVRAGLAGQGQVVLVTGEPGMGKSRLAEEVAGRAGELGLRCGWGRATQEEGSPPYWPFHQVVRNLAGGADPGLRTPEPRGTEPAGADERFRLFEAVTEVLVRAAEPSGSLVVLDDLQWADPASLRLLVHLTRGVRQSRLVVLGLYRDTEVGEPLRAALSALAGEPAVTRLRLAGLTEPEVAARLTGVIGWAVPDSVASAVCRRTRGNPFFVGELGRLLSGAGDRGPEELPDAVRDAVRGRLARLSEPGRSVVCAAAVLGSEVEPAAITASSGRELAGVLAALDEASAAGIVTSGRFTHDLIREVARLEVGTAERLALHQRMAEYLAGLADADARVAEVAFHWLESLPAGDAAAAVRWAERAADRAMAQLAWEEADTLYGRAVAASADPRFTPSDRCRLLLGRTRARVRAYDMDGARQCLLEAVEIARAARDTETIAAAVLTMEGVTDFLWDSIGRTLCEEALAGIPDGDSAVRARLLAMSVVADSWQPGPRARARSVAALEMAERVGDRRAVVEALRARQMVHSAPDGAADRLALGDRLLELGGEADTELWGRLWRFDALAQLGELDRAEAELGPIGVVAERLRSPLARWHALRCRAAIAQARGRFALAETLGQQATDLARRAGHEGALTPSQGFQLLVQTLTGRAWSGQDDVAELRASSLAMLRSLDASWLLVAGRRSEAERIYRSLPPPGSVPGFMLLSSLGGFAELAQEFADRDTAAEVYRLLSPFADLFVCGGAGVIAIYGSARLPLGRAAATAGRLDDAVRHLRLAAEANDRAGTPPFAATARGELARVLARRRRPGDREEAAALSASAAATAAELGMDPLRRTASELAAQLAGRSGTPLTRREQEIAELVARGLTNRQIAAALHISERTAETHVQHILGKLGFTGRAQVAAWVAGGKVSTGDP